MPHDTDFFPIEEPTEMTTAEDSTRGAFCKSLTESRDFIDSHPAT